MILEFDYSTNYTEPECFLNTVKTFLYKLKNMPGEIFLLN